MYTARNVIIGVRGHFSLAPILHEGKKDSFMYTIDLYSVKYELRTSQHGDSTLYATLKLHLSTLHQWAAVIYISA